MKSDVSSCITHDEVNHLHLCLQLGTNQRPFLLYYKVCFFVRTVGILTSMSWSECMSHRSMFLYWLPRDLDLDNFR